MLVPLDYDSGDEGRTREIRGGQSYKPEPVFRARERMGRGKYGIWTGTAFVPPNPYIHPNTIFPSRKTDATSSPRYCLSRRYISDLYQLKTMAVYTDGACSDNGNNFPGVIPRGGCSFVYNDTVAGTVAFPLEDTGPTGQLHRHTSNRAELSAVIQALGCQAWYVEGFERVVIITDSEYVAQNAVGALRIWASRGWTTTQGGSVANRDLWMELSQKMGEYAQEGCEVSFWAIPREWNAVADRAAKDAINKPQSTNHQNVNHLPVFASYGMQDLGRHNW